MNYKQLLLTLLISILSYVSFLVVGTILVGYLPSNISYFVIVGKIHSIAQVCGILILLIGAYFTLDKESIIASLSLHKIRWRQGLIAVGIILIANLLLLSLGRYFTFTDGFDWPVAFSMPIRDIVLLLVSLIIISPLYEEILFRGYIFQGLLQSGLRTGSVVLLSALLWAAFLKPHDSMMWGLALLIGIILGFARLRTHSVITTLLMHVTFVILQMINYSIISY